MRNSVPMIMGTMQTPPRTSQAANRSPAGGAPTSTLRERKALRIMPSTPSERSQHARIAALSKIAQAPSGTALTEAARRAFLDKFYDATDPALPEAERQRQADAARRAHFARLGYRSAVARRRAREATESAAEAAADLARRADAV